MVDCSPGYITRLAPTRVLNPQYNTVGLVTPSRRSPVKTQQCYLTQEDGVGSQCDISGQLTIVCVDKGVPVVNMSDYKYNQHYGSHVKNPRMAVYLTA